MDIFTNLFWLSAILFLLYLCIYSVVQKELPYFMLRLPPDAACL